MPDLVAPTAAVRDSFRTAMAEFRAEGRGAPDDHSTVGDELRTLDAMWSTPQGFASYVAGLHREADPRSPRRPGYVPCTTWWWVAGTEYLGRIAIRHRLSDGLWRVGGHIGYDVRPTARRNGHATMMLRTVLPHARSLDITRALLTCDVGNIASRKVIEANGGELWDELDGMFRFWVPTE